MLEHSTGPAFFVMAGDGVRVAPGFSETPVASGLNKPGFLAFGSEGQLSVRP